MTRSRACTTAYDAACARTLAACCGSYLPAGFRRAALFRAPRVGFRRGARARGDVLPEVDCGSLVLSDDFAVLVLKDPLPFREWILECTADQVPYDVRDALAGRVHLGSMLQYRLLAEQVRRAVRAHAPGRLLATGHGPGGCLAVLAAADLAPLPVEVYTFGAPRVGDERFAAFFDRLVPATFRVVNAADPAPMLPRNPARGTAYCHVGREVSFLRRTGDLLRNHAIETYREGLRD